MRPLILHNVPAEELYTGDDGVQRPYGMYWPEGERQQRNLPRSRAREVTETGSFGKSTRRSRSRTGSAPPKREDATMQSADKLFSNYIARQQATTTATSAAASAPTQRKSSYLGQTAPQSQDDPASATQALTYRKEPSEVILRGYSSPSQQYAAINHYEQLAGRICEDYSREPPIESRRYKSDLRDPALTRRQPLTPEERAKVSRVASGEHWVKVTFESTEAAEAAVYTSPQKIMGHLVFAEHYVGTPPKEDAALLDIARDAAMVDPFRTAIFRERERERTRRPSQPGSASTPNANGNLQDSPSQSSTQTIDTATASTATVTGAAPAPEQPQNAEQQPEDNISRKLIGARRIKLLPAEQALAPQKTLQQRLLEWIPLIGWFGGSMIGNEVPRNEVGEFDFNRASLYWQLMFYLDLWFGLFSRELVSGDKDD